jgi:outer membrane receptor protein involved in Fe transport
MKPIIENCWRATCLYLLLTASVSAQATGGGGGAGGTATPSTTAPASPGPATPKTADSTNPAPKGTMDTIVVTAVPPGEQVVPTARPISSVYGDDMSIIDIPRSVNIITKQQLEDRQITSVQDLGQFASGTYSPAEYGLDGIPYIRGVYASLYQNGQQEIFFRNSVVPSFNQVESMDLVKGPGSATYGPPGGGPGGYVNIITKTPEFDKNHT